MICSDMKPEGNLTKTKTNNKCTKRKIKKPQKTRKEIDKWMKKEAKI